MMGYLNEKISKATVQLKSNNLAMITFNLSKMATLNSQMKEGELVKRLTTTVFLNGFIQISNS